MAKVANKRFYKDVSVKEVDGGFWVQLDGRTLKTPGKHVLIAPTRIAAELIAAEWDAQGDDIIPTSMPVTRLLNVAVEQTPDNREALIAEARKYAGTDVLCYREGTVRLHAEEQNKLWNPVLDWAKTQGVNLETTSALNVIKQPQSSLDAIANYARRLDDVFLTLYVHLTSVFGSAILAMAVLEKQLEGEAAYDLSRLDELWQIKYWGEDYEAKDRTEAIKNEINALCALIT